MLSLVLRNSPEARAVLALLVGWVFNGVLEWKKSACDIIGHVVGS